MTRVIPRLVGLDGLRIGVCVYAAAAPHNHSDLCFLVQLRLTPVSDGTCVNCMFYHPRHWADTFFDALGSCQVRIYLKLQRLTAFK